MSILSTGTSALINFQRALSTVSHNVANINTEGYSRQRVEFATRTPTDMGYGYVGNGAKITDVGRVADQLAISRLLDSGGELSRLQQLSSLSGRVDSLFSDKATNVAGLWSNFFDAASALSSNASSTAERQNLLDSAGALTTRFQQLNGQLDGLSNEVNSGLTSATDEVNRLTQQIAKINGTIGNNIDKAPPDLLDQRDALVSKLVGYTGGTAVMQDGGFMNVFTAGGQALVVGTNASKLTTVPDPYQPSKLQMAMQTQGQNVSLNAGALGGQIGGLLEFRSNVLEPTQAELGRLAVAMASSFNDAHSQGVDLYGALGGNFFNTGNPAVAANPSNTGTASLSASFGDLSAVDGQNVSLSFDGTNWKAARTDTGAAVAITGTGTAADPLLINGVRVVVGGAAANGDKFLLQPTNGLAGKLSVAITDPSRIAAATAVKATAPVGNLGTGKISDVKVTNASNPALLTPSSVDFIDANQYTIDGAGPFPYTAGQTISANGWSFVLDGVPKAGDSFGVGPMGAGSSDNGNAKLLAGVEDRKALNGGTVTLNGALAGLTTSVGSAARAADYAADAQKVINDQAQASRDSISGVNLDEEAADMLKLQQAYQAAAQMISTADTLFQSILNAVR
ncbi:flagellar hook-associated protein FlgK [Xanthomonas maliensis]|uniref:flagellar hook-associated protein FlgK n=1 Tax=Xanthomonas maliensis TaxID=1321368 RepID=UPI00039B9A2C|nr:flagellar hook-associated protein FlgK [Xanthomonas maliensis]KAB7771864.1 flagellar hook-associated protein FlgK [Xanthomonas maliensis]